MQTEMSKATSKDHMGSKAWPPFNTSSLNGSRGLVKNVMGVERGGIGRSVRISSNQFESVRCGFCWGDVALCFIGTFTKEVLLHLAREVLSSSQVCQIEPVFIDQHGLML